MYIKLFWLKLQRVTALIFKRIPYILSYLLLAISALISIALLVPHCFDRVPVLSYLIIEHKLPITYEIDGKILLLDEDNNIVDTDVTVFVGGYYTSTSSDEFKLTFSSPSTSEIYIVFCYEFGEKTYEVTKKLSLEENTHVITEEFVIYV